MHTKEEQGPLKRIGSEGEEIRRWCTNPAARLPHDTSSFVARTCRVCAVARRFDNSGKRRLRLKQTRKSAHASSTFVPSVKRFRSNNSFSTNRTTCCRRPFSEHV